VTADPDTGWSRPLPYPSLLTRFFWESGSDGRLRFMRCAECRRFHHPPSPICPDCHSRAVAPEPVSGRGVVHSFSVNHQDWTRSGEAPFVYAVIELEEQKGLRMTANVVDCPPDAVFVGMEVAVRFLAVEDVHLPLFAPRPRVVP
jgi:uncharacterized OB-fold protein